MTITDAFRGALRRLAQTTAMESVPRSKRRTVALPSILNAYAGRPSALPKPTPANLRRFAETPVARRAINTIKDRVVALEWCVRPKDGVSVSDIPDGELRIQALTGNLQAPNPDDSFRSFAEQVPEDVIVGGYGAAELQLTGDPGRPLNLFPVDGATILMKSDWDGRPGSPRYVQSTGRHGPEANPTLNDDELMYIRLNPRTHTPFGLGRLEVAFETVNEFLTAHRHAARLANNSVVQYALWLEDLTPAHHERLIRWWQDEIEGTGRVPILSADKKPEVLRFGSGTDSDLRLSWQEFVLRIIADAFDLPPLFLGLEHDVNRSTASELSDLAFHGAIAPTARLLSEHLTRDAIAKKLGWSDLEFVFPSLDAPDELKQAQLQEILIRSGIMTVNEVRRLRGLPELTVSG